MGMMTTITILNDAFDIIKANPEQFIENIELGIHGRKGDSKGSYYGGDFVNSYGVGNYANPMWVTQSTHSNTPVLMLSYGNMLASFGHRNSVKNLNARRKMLELAKEIIAEEERIINGLEMK